MNNGSELAKYILFLFGIILLIGGISGMIYSLYYIHNLGLWSIPIILVSAILDLTGYAIIKNI